MVFEKHVFLGCCTPIKCAIESNKRQSNRTISLLMFSCEERDGRGGQKGERWGGKSGKGGGGQWEVKHMANERGWKKWCFHYVNDLSLSWTPNNYSAHAHT